MLLTECSLPRTQSSTFAMGHEMMPTATRSMRTSQAV